MVDLLNRMVKEIFPSRKKPKLTKEGKNFRSNNKIPRDVRNMFRKKMKLTKILKNVKTKDRCVKALQELRQVEDSIRFSDFKRKDMKEKHAVEKMKES